MNTPIFVGPDPCQGWEKTIQGLDRNTEDDTSLPCPEEKDGKLSLTVAEDTNVISFLRKEYKDLCHIDKALFFSMYPLEPSLCFTEADTSSFRSLRLNRSRSCRPGESILPNGLDKDFPRRPKGFLPKLHEMEFGDAIKKFSRQDSQTSVRSVSLDEKTQNVKTSGEWDTNSAHKSVAQLNEMVGVQSAMELGDDMVMELIPDVDDTTGKISLHNEELREFFKGF
ncbi:hypothetical protein AAG906_008742 [Vitis piasezkii]